jgi:GTP-binding protein
MDNDLAVMELLDSSAVSYGLVLTKSDELEPRDGEAALTKAATEAAKHTAALQEIHLTSSQTSHGMAELRTSIAKLI